MIRQLLFFLANHLPQIRLTAPVRRMGYRLTGMKVGPSSIISSPLRVRPVGATPSIRIGTKTFLNENVQFGGQGGVTIGDYCQIGPNVSFETTTHALDFQPGNARDSLNKPVTVADHVWIGSGAIILPGVSIGYGAVVGAGAIVTRDVSPLTVVAGNPARPIRQIQARVAAAGLPKLP